MTILKAQGKTISHNDVDIGLHIGGKTIWQCQKCEHTWSPNSRTKGRRPKECPKCKVLTWHKEKQG